MSFTYCLMNGFSFVPLTPRPSFWSILMTTHSPFGPITVFTTGSSAPRMRNAGARTEDEAAAAMTEPGADGRKERIAGAAITWRAGALRELLVLCCVLLCCFRLCLSVSLDTLDPEPSFWTLGYTTPDFKTEHKGESETTPIKDIA